MSAKLFASVEPLLSQRSSLDAPAEPSQDELLDNDVDVADEFAALPRWRRPSVYWMLPPYALYTLAFGGVIVPKMNLILSLICRKYLMETSTIMRMTIIDSPVAGMSFPPPEDCRIAPVQVQVSQFTMICSIISALLSGIATPKLGALSDRYGRTRVIVATNIGMMIGEVLSILVATKPDTFSVYLLVLGAISDGVTGSFTAGMAIAHSYAADCTPPEKRSVAFGYFHGCLCVGIALGPFIASMMVKHANGSILPVLYASLVAHVIFILSLAFIVPESLSPSRQRAARTRHALEKEANRIQDLAIVNSEFDSPAFLGSSRPNIFQAICCFNRRTWHRFTTSRLIVHFARSTRKTFWEPLKIFFPSGPGTTPALRRNLLLLPLMDSILIGVAMGTSSIAILYLNFRFGWTTIETSLFMSVISVVRVLTLVIGLPLLARVCLKSLASSTETDNVQISVPTSADMAESESGAVVTRTSGTSSFDFSVVRAALIFDVIAFAGYAISWTGRMFVISGAIGAIGTVASPTLQASMTKHVAPNQVGQLLGATGLLHALFRVVTPMVFNLVYAATIGKPGLSQTVFVMLSVSFAFVFVLSLFLRPNVLIPVEKSVGAPPEGSDTPGEEYEHVGESPTALGTACCKH